ncbi:MAG: hypothetical protein NTV23_09640 [Propionibacteriales bacterium]|nr:hypothetical protein [Propionibacteriales bacterium]
MSGTLRSTLGVLVAVLALGLAGCGGDDDGPVAVGPSASPTPSASLPPSLSPSSNPGGPLVPDAGVPSDFPITAVPLVPGAVSQPLGAGSSGEEGRKGWILEVAAAKAPEDCFADAAAALVAKGFVLAAGPDRSAGNVEAQYTSPGYAVIVSARDDGSGGCTLGYEIGQIAP